MPIPYALIGLALTVAGTIKASQDAKKDARALRSRQQALFANQDRFSKQTQEKLLNNLKKFSAEEDQSRRNEASDTALESIEKVVRGAESIRRGKPNLGIAGKVSAAKQKLDRDNAIKEKQDNAYRNQTLANFLGISGGAVKTGREYSNLNQALNTLRTDARGQLAVDQARVAHSPKTSPLMANLLKAGGMAAGFAGAAGAGGAGAVGSSSASLSAADPTIASLGDLSSTGGNWLGQTGGSAMQGFAPVNPTNYTPFFNAPTQHQQFGARWLDSAPTFKFGNLIPR